MLKSFIKNVLRRYFWYLLNSRMYWKLRFHMKSWQFSGVSQCEYFMNVILKYLPESIKLDLIQNFNQIADIGCATGNGTFLLKEFVNKSSKVVGFDIAIDDHTENDCIFIKSDIYKLKTNFDVGIISNVLEHFDNPIELLEENILNMTKKYIIILVPYEENYPLCIEHRIRIEKDFWPQTIGNFTKLFEKNLVCDEISHWCTNQQMIIYADLYECRSCL